MRRNPNGQYSPTTLFGAMGTMRLLSAFQVFVGPKRRGVTKAQARAVITEMTGVKPGAVSGYPTGAAPLHEYLYEHGHVAADGGHMDWDEPYAWAIPAAQSMGYGHWESNPQRRRNSKALWSRNDWRIEWYDPQKKWRGFHIAGKNHADHASVFLPGVRSDAPTQITYDRPESVPKYVQKAVAQLAQKYESQMDGYNNPKRRKNYVAPSGGERKTRVFFMETRGKKYNVKVYKAGSVYEVVIYERGVPTESFITSDKNEVWATVGQFYKIGHMTGTAKYKVKQDNLGLGIE